MLHAEISTEKLGMSLGMRVWAWHLLYTFVLAKLNPFSSHCSCMLAHQKPLSYDHFMLKGTMLQSINLLLCLFD